MKAGLFVLSTVLLSLSPLVIPLSAAKMPDENHNQTILLDESAIQGERLEDAEGVSPKKKRADLPALSTALRWEGNEIEALDIPKEILEQLTRPDLSYILERNTELEEID